MQDGEDCGGINLVAKVKILEKIYIYRQKTERKNEHEKYQKLEIFGEPEDEVWCQKKKVCQKEGNAQTCKHKSEKHNEKDEERWSTTLDYIRVLYKGLLYACPYKRSRGCSLGHTVRR